MPYSTSKIKMAKTRPTVIGQPKDSISLRGISGVDKNSLNDVVEKDAVLVNVN